MFGCGKSAQRARRLADSRLRISLLFLCTLEALSRSSARLRRSVYAHCSSTASLPSASFAQLSKGVRQVSANQRQSQRTSLVWPMDRQAATEVSISGNQDRASLAPFIIGVAGGTASGKTSVCRKIMKQLRKDVPVSAARSGSFRQLRALGAAPPVLPCDAYSRVANSIDRPTMQVKHAPESEKQHCRRKKA